jgi:hypothetical protein
MRGALVSFFEKSRKIMKKMKRKNVRYAVGKICRLFSEVRFWRKEGVKTSGR